MPAVSEKQRRFMMAELSRMHHGKRTRTEMTSKQLHDFGRVKRKRKRKKH